MGAAAIRSVRRLQPFADGASCLLARADEMPESHRSGERAARGGVGDMGPAVPAREAPAQSKWT